MAVMMVRHIRMYIRLIVVQINWFGLRIIRRPVVIVIRRRPRTIRSMAVHFPHRRTFDEHRTNDVVIAIQIRISDHLHIQSIRKPLCYEGSYVLENRGRQTSLNQQSMVRTAASLYHAQIVDPSVAVEVEIIDHILTGVDDLLELAHTACLSESSGYRIEVEIETEVLVIRGNIDRCGGRHFRRRGRDTCGVLGAHRHHHFIRRSYRPDTRPATRHSQHSKG